VEYRLKKPCGESKSGRQKQGYNYKRVGVKGQGENGFFGKLKREGKEIRDGSR